MKGRPIQSACCLTDECRVLLGTMTSSITGDEILIDGMPVGNFFIFAWNSKYPLSCGPNDMS